MRTETEKYKVGELCEFWKMIYVVYRVSDYPRFTEVYARRVSDGFETMFYDNEANSYQWRRA